MIISQENKNSEKLEIGSSSRGRYNDRRKVFGGFPGMYFGFIQCSLRLLNIQLLPRQDLLPQVYFFTLPILKHVNVPIRSMWTLTMLLPVPDGRGGTGSCVSQVWVCGAVIPEVLWRGTRGSALFSSQFQ